MMAPRLFTMAFIASLMMSSPVPASSGDGAWVSICTAEGATLRPVPGGEDVPGQGQDAQVACHAPFSLPRKLPQKGICPGC